jgi:POT family proton-dependent oligopeptide transporter
MFGHPRGLFVLFFTELWERFSFYGMKALLILYMVEYLVWSQHDASEVFKWYTSLVYATPVLGGFIADAFLGARRSVAIGCVLITLGHLSLAFEPMAFFYSGLGLLVVGVGFLKANISTQVGSMYRPDDPRRDAGFTIFYMGINAGAFLGPIVCGWLRFHYGWHYGFAAAAVGMFVGLIIYLAGQRWVIDVSRAPEEPESGAAGAGRERWREQVLAPEGQEPGAGALQEAAPAAPEPESISRHVRRDRIIVLVTVCLFAVLFWMCFEQMANAMMRWASDQTNLRPFDLKPETAGVEGFDTVQPPPGGWRGLEITPEQTQSINPLFIILLGPVFAWFWMWLDRRNKQPSSPSKLAVAVLLMAMAWGVMLLAGQKEDQPSRAPLASLPEHVHLEEYGATRLHYDPETHTLEMKGVLPHLDRVRLLGESASDEYKKAVQQLVQKAQERSASAARGESWEVNEAVPQQAAPSIVAQVLPDSVRWDADARTLTATAEIPERDELRVLAAGADPGFRNAINAIYRQSSLYRITMWWLVLHFLLATMGELCLSPVGLSLVTKLAPAKNVGLFMGLWFLTTGFMANQLAHQLGGEWGTMTPDHYFSIFAIISVAATVLMLILRGPLKRRMHGVP